MSSKVKESKSKESLGWQYKELEFDFKEYEQISIFEGEKMKYGSKDIKDLTEKQKENLLNEILDNCVKYAGDSYEDFARPVIKLLVKKKLADYGN